MGNEGWLSTGATRMSSSIIPKANPPVKHIPSAPTPGPPQVSWASAASARSHRVTGAVRLAAKAANSFETQAGSDRPDGVDDAMARPRGRRTERGSTTVQPMPATRRAKSATFGVMPGISAITMTAGPSPSR